MISHSNATRMVFYLALIGGFALTVLGLWQQWGGATSFALKGGYLPDYSISFIVIGVMIELLSRIVGLNRLVLGGIVACIIAILTNTTWPLLVTVWFALSSYLLGRIVLTLLKINKDKQSNITAALVGAGAYGTVVGLLAHFPINYPALYGMALTLPIVFEWRTLVDMVRYFSKHLTQPSEFKWLDLVIALVALVHFSVALMPEVGHDALAVHLFVPGHLLSRHEWGFDVTTYVWAAMPMMGDWIYSIGYMMGGETAARMINVGFIFVLGWLIRDLVIWAGGNALGTRWATLLFLTTPLTFTESNTLYIESIWTAFIIAGSLSVFKLLQSNNDQSEHLPVAGFLLGGALALKAVTLAILPVFLLMLLWKYGTWAQRKLSSYLLLGLVLFFAVGIIPYVTAWYLTGNPVFPFFNKLFQSQFYSDIENFTNTLYQSGFTWDVLYQATFYTGKYAEGSAGTPGFQWMLLFFPALLVLLLSKKYRGVILFTVAILSIFLTFQSQSYLRYVFPSFVWVATGIGVALSATKYTNADFYKKTLSIIVGIVVLLNLIFFKSGTHYGTLSIEPLMSPSGRESYINNRLPIRSAIKMLNQINILRTPVAVFSQPLTAGLNADALYPNWYNPQFNEKVLGATTSDAIAQMLLGEGVDYIILDSTWGNVNNRNAIENATHSLAELGEISVRKINSNYQFQVELLKNPNFSSQEGWVLPADMPDHSLGDIAVSVSSNAYQAVPVEAGRRYQNSVTAQCPDRPTQGRIQVNWLDSHSNTITTSIRVFECAAVSTTHTIEVKAPPDASVGIVYVSGHTSIPVIFKKVSFKQ